MAAWLLADFRSIVEVSNAVQTNAVQTVLTDADKRVREAFLRRVNR